MSHFAEKVEMPVEDWNNFGKEQSHDAWNTEDNPVMHPSHYAKGGIECIDAIKASMTAEAFSGYCKGNVLKYLWRYESKGKALEDLKKAQVYLGWLIANEGQTA